MYARLRRRKHDRYSYEYVDIVESYRVDGKVRQRVLGTLGRTDELPPEKIDGLIASLRKLATPEGLGGIALGDVEVQAIREYGVVLVGRRLWEELGLNLLLNRIPQTKGVPVEEAVFRMVVNRLCDPLSKLGLVDWIDDKEVLHKGWQGRVHWPSGNPALDHNQYLRAMDRLKPHRQQIEDAMFSRVVELFSLPLQLVFYDLTSTYFEGDGVCELAEYGYSRDHRDDRAQVVVGLAITQEGLPITHRVFAGNTADVTTFAPMAEELKQRFGLTAPTIVADRGMFSADNVVALQQSGMRYILALRSRQQTEGEIALELARRAGLPRPKAPASPWQLREVDVIPGVRHVVVYSAFKAVHDFQVRARRIRRALADLLPLQKRAGRLKQRRLVERVTRILSEHKCAAYFTYEVADGSLRVRLDRGHYREQRRHDGVFVLETNHPGLSTEEIVSSYRQLMEVERAFRVLKSLIRVRPIYHYRDRRVETHIFICFLAYLLAKVLEQRLRAAGLQQSVAHALDQLSELKTVEHTWQKRALVVRTTRPDPAVKAILDAVGIRQTSPIVSITKTSAA